MKKLIPLVLLITTFPIFAQKIVQPVSNLKNSYTIENSAYSLGFAENYGLPVWEMHVLTPNMLEGTFSTQSEWKQDQRVKGFRISKKDIEGQKLEPVQLYPKTHAKHDLMAQDSCYLTSNLLFMCRSLKDSVWEKITYSFELLAKQYGRVYTYSGPVFDKDPLKIKHMFNNRVAIPSYFYRIALYFVDGKPAYKCYLIKNRIPTDYDRSCDVEEFNYNIFQLEADTGIDFFESFIDVNFRQDKMKFLENKH
ncbi:DNA/RNA non-specific endonuclease [uncultured Treponema sp.]|uniref:DNA/RNA non-specific endonuclease n=1 Tax=uncultured Treponema sp. TaxID=162155 RepID=UPI0025E21D83|nr:DNA/RNA non-specific endonuclease [uncultured Treponema sp.]